MLNRKRLFEIATQVDGELFFDSGRAYQKQGEVRMALRVCNVRYVDIVGVVSVLQCELANQGMTNIGISARYWTSDDIRTGVSGGKRMRGDPAYVKHGRIRVCFKFQRPAPRETMSEAIEAMIDGILQ